MGLKIIWLLFVCSLLSLLSYSQTPVLKTELEKKLSIRNAFEEPDDKSTPAKASFTLPDTGKNSYLVNLGISYDFKWSKIFASDRVLVHQFSPFAVFNRNTMIDQPQYNYKGGFSYELQTGYSNDDSLCVHYINSALEYLRNKIDSSHSILFTSYWSFVKNNISKPENKFFINYYKMIAGSSFFYNVAPSAGIELQDIFQSTKDSTGFQARGYVNPALNLALRRPSKSQKKTGVKNHYDWPKLFELTVNYTMRYAFLNTVSGSSNYIPLFKTSLNYYPGYSDNFSIALSYNSGADPTAGLAKQKFWELAVQFKK